MASRPLADLARVGAFEHDDNLSVLDAVYLRIGHFQDAPHDLGSSFREGSTTTLDM